MKFLTKNTIIKFIKFGIVGFLKTTISYILYTSLVYINLHYIIANIIAF